MNKPTMILIQPRSGEWENFQGLGPPLSLLSACSLAVYGFDVEIFDQRLYGENWRERLKVLLEKRAVLVGITTMVGAQIGHALSLAEYVRNFDNQIPVVFGGVFPGMAAELALGDSRIDVVLRGEGERVLPELAAAFVEGRPFDNVPGISFRKEGNVIHSDCPARLDLNSLPELPYHLVDMPLYVRNYRSGRAFAFESSRGCPMGCTFCYNAVFHQRKWRALTAENAIRRIVEAKRQFDFDKLYFVDDNSFVDKERFLQIAEGLRGMGVKWISHGLTPGDSLRWSNDDFRRLAESGCIELGIGLESGSEPELRLLGKNFDVEEILQLNRRLAGFAIPVSYNFMFGIPDSTRQDRKRTVSTALRLVDENRHASVHHMTCYLPLPGTVLAERVRERGFELPDRFSDWAGMDMLQADLPWLSKRDKQTLNAIAFAGLFVGGHRFAMQGVNGILPRILERLYRPLARWRLEHMNFSFPVELWLKDILTRLVRH